MLTRAALATALMTIVATAPIAAEKPQRQFIVNNDAVGVPVFPYDITDRHYTVIGEVKAGVRKATVFSSEPSQAKIYRELWERADKLGADAVIKATYGDSHITALSWGSTTATGIAIKFDAAPPSAGTTAASPGK